MLVQAPAGGAVTADAAADKQNKRTASRLKEPPQKDNKKPILRISVEEPAENPQALLFAHVRKGRKQPVNCPRPRYLKSAAKNDLSIRVKPHRYTMCTYGA